MPSVLSRLLGLAPDPRVDVLVSQVRNLGQWRDYFDRKAKAMSVELDALKAAIAADADADAKLVAYLGTVKAGLDDANAKIVALQAQVAAGAAIDPAELQALADQLNAHAAEVATHLPADPAPAPAPTV